MWSWDRHRRRLCRRLRRRLQGFVNAISQKPLVRITRDLYRENYLSGSQFSDFEEKAAIFIIIFVSAVSRIQSKSLMILYVDT